MTLLCLLFSLKNILCNFVREGNVIEYHSCNSYKHHYSGNSYDLIFFSCFCKSKRYRPLQHNSIPIPIPILHTSILYIILMVWMLYGIRRTRSQTCSVVEKVR